MTRLRRDRVSLGRRGRVVYWGHWTCRVGGTSPRCCVGVYSSGSLRRYSAARGQRTDTPLSGPEDRYSALAYRRVPLLGTLIRYSEAGSSPPHANPLFRMWATPPTCGTGGPRAEQAAHVRNRRPTCGTGGPRAEQAAYVRNRGLACEHSMTPWPPRPRHEEAGTNALISLSVMPISMSSKTQVRRVALVKSFVEEDEPSAVLMM